MQSSLFNLPPRSTKAGDTAILNKSKSKIKSMPSIKGGKDMFGVINSITDIVNRLFADKQDLFEIIDSEDKYKEYIESIINNGMVAIDTETTGLNPMEDKIAGLCLYTLNEKAVYIPINHISYITGVRYENQLSKEIIKKGLERLVKSKVKIIMFNSVFDIRVILNNLDIKLHCYWDCYIGARLLNELEEENNLKFLHNKYCVEDKKTETFSYDDLFKSVSFINIPIKVAYQYAANDAILTYELYEFQKDYLDENHELCKQHELEGPAWIMKNIEMPLVDAVVDMEQTGIAFDVECNKKLQEKYSKKLKEKEKAFLDFCDENNLAITEYRNKHFGNCKLSDPILISSPTQISILLYDILGYAMIDNKRGTGEDILNKINKPICKLILEYREVEKLMSTYITKMLKIVNPKTGRIHARFNQMGTDTGRFSSSDPNMQNIPSNNKDIRKMFVATEGYYLLSSDYSAQEPRLTAHMSNDQKMIQAYKDGKDLYIEIASLSFNLSYDECSEFRADGSHNPEGKKRRNTAKAIVLGICYGKGVPAIADDLNITREKAQEIYDRVMMNFPGLKQFMIDSENMAIEKGYVNTVWGRKRRLPDMQLQKYVFTKVSGGENFDPLFDDDFEDDFEVSEALINKYTRLMERAYGRFNREKVKQLALKEGISIKDNSGFIAEATRQCVNSRIQGSAADQTKIAMILVHNNKRLKELGFRLLLQVHDELIGECPKENVKECTKLFSDLMIEAAKDLKVPSKCDVEITECWYGEHLKI